jgi:SM-20-related protein
MNLFDAPPPLLHIRNWLGQDRVAWLLNYARERESLFRPSGVNTRQGVRVDRNVRISLKTGPVPEVAAEIEGRVRESIPQIFHALGADLFQPSSYETEIVAHGDGAFLRTHRDAKPGLPHGRAISGVYYFYREPKRFSGGQLRLYSLSESKKPGTFVDIEPENDSVVFFPPWFPHEVLPVSCASKQFMDSRFAINCWLRR